MTNKETLSKLFEAYKDIYKEDIQKELLRTKIKNYGTTKQTDNKLI